MSLGEWLDEVIADTAADQGVDPEDFDEDDRLEAIGDRLSGLSHRRDPREERSRRDRDYDDPRVERRRRAAPDDSRRAEQLLDDAILRFESRAAKREARTARALNSVASVIEVGRRDERKALHAVVDRLESLEERIARQREKPPVLARRPPPRTEPGDDRAANESEARAARALDSRPNLAEDGRAGALEERDALNDVVGRLESLEERIVGQQAKPPVLARRPPPRPEPSGDRAGDEREARAPDSRANAVEDGQAGGREERDALKAVVGRLDSLEECIAREQVARDGAATRPRPVRPDAANRADPPRPIEARVSEPPQRFAAPDRDRGAPRPRARIDIENAVAQIAQRRHELDARSAGAEAAPAAREPAVSPLQIEIRKLGQRLDELRREQAERRETPGAGVEALRDDLAAMSRSLADLAPRNAVVALEGAIRDLSQRVVASRENGARESLLAPVEELVDSLRDALRAHDPREAVQALRREIGAIGAKVDGIGEVSIDPRAFEPIQHQLEETRALLASLAQRPMPLDRLERQIGELADRVENLSTSATPHAESAQLLVALDEARAQVERSTSASALNSIEARLEEIAARMDHALERPLAAPVINSRAIEDLSLRIDGVRQAIEEHQASPGGASLDTSLLEQAMREISAKLDRPVTASIDANAFEGLFHDLGERIDRRPPSAIDTAPLERALRRLEDQGAGPDTVHLEDMMREISAKLDRPVTAAIDANAFEELFHDLGTRIDRRPAGLEAQAAAPDTAHLEQLMREISAKLDRPVTAAIDANAFEDLFHDLGTRIDRRPAGLAPQAAGPDTAHLEQLMREISEKLDKPTTAAVDTRALESLFHDLAARIERRPAAVVDTAPLEQVLRKFGDRPSPTDTRPLEDLIREISAKLDRATQPAIDIGAIESMIHDIGARIERRPEVIVDTRNLEQTLHAIQDRIEQSEWPRAIADRIEKALGALSAQIASRSGPREGGPLEEMVAESLTRLEEIRKALRSPQTQPDRAPAGDAAIGRDLAELRAEQSNADRRLQSTLGGVHTLLETLVDRIGQIEDDVARVGPTPQARNRGASPETGRSDGGAVPASFSLNATDATLRESPPPSPPRPVLGQRGDKAPLRAPQYDAAQPMRSIDGSEFLIEPGAGTPMRASADEAIGKANPKAAINAHIAAARRAAQAALAEAANDVSKENAKPSKEESASAGGLGRAQAFFASRRRPLLLGAALVALLAIVVVELGVWRQPTIQKSEIPIGTAPRLASADPVRDGGAPAKTEARALDPTPTGSLTAPAAGGATTRFLTPAPADIVATIPPAAPRSLREAAAAGDPAAQFELASRLAEGRGLPRDPHGAFVWFDRAAAQGLAPAQYRLAALYEKGLGVTRDPAAARSWYVKAAEAGNARAMHNLAVLIAEGGGAKPDYAEAAGWFRKAAQMGVKDSQFNLAILCARGMGVTQDLGEAWLWFSLAAQQGDAEAAKKRDEVAAKMDAKALAAAGAALTNFHAAPLGVAANEVTAPPGGWEPVRSAPPQATNPALATPGAPI